MWELTWYSLLLKTHTCGLIAAEEKKQQSVNECCNNCSGGTAETWSCNYTWANSLQEYSKQQTPMVAFRVKPGAQDGTRGHSFTSHSVQSTRIDSLMGGNDASITPEKVAISGKKRGWLLHCDSASLSMLTYHTSPLDSSRKCLWPWSDPLGHS